MRISDANHPIIFILFGDKDADEVKDAEALAKGFSDEGYYAVTVKRPVCFEDCLSLVSRMSGETEEKDFPSQYYDNILNDRAGMFRHAPFVLEQRLVEHVMQGNKAEALATLVEINDRGNKATLAKNPLRSAKNSLICSCTFLTRAAIQAGVADEEAFALSDAVIQHVETLADAAAVSRYEPEMLLQFIKLTQKSKGRGYARHIRKALHYIDSNLDKQLRLKDIAAYAGVHPNYLSKLFALETGGTLSSYIVTRKIREAAYFVRHAEYSIAEIANLYGFSSQSHFITSFKKIMGITPGQYRNQ
jgi:AraC-like DNA-binding protein